MSNFLQDIGRTLERGALNAVYGKTPFTRTRTAHAFTLQVRGVIIGAAQSLSFRQSAGITDIYELNPYAHGLPNHLAFDGVTGRSISLERLDLYTDQLEEVFGDGEWLHLGQTIPNLTLDEVWKAPGSFLADRKMYRYTGVAIESIDRNVRATDPLITVSASLRWTNRELLDDGSAGLGAFGE
jgi:hypothetical protein